MPVYLVTALLATLLCFFACRVRQRLPAGISLKERGHRREIVLFWVLVIGSALPYVLVSGFRYDVGTDYFFTYEPLMCLIRDGMLQPGQRVEPAFMLLCEAAVFFGKGITWVMLLSTVITVLFFWLAFYGESDIPWLSVFLLAGARPFFISMNCVRQYMGMAIVLFAFRFIKEKCFWKYALCVGVAALFHVSVLILLPLYFVRYLQLNPLLGGGLLALSFLLKTPLMALMRFVVSKTPYAEYIGTVYDSVPPTYPEKFWAMLPLLVVVSVYYFVGENRKDPLFRVFYLCQLGVMFFTLNRNIIPLAERVSWMLEMPQLLLVPMLIHREPGRRKKILIAALLLGSLLWLTWYEIFKNGYHEVVPYRCVFFPELGIL